MPYLRVLIIISFLSFTSSIVLGQKEILSTPSDMASYQQWLKEGWLNGHLAIRNDSTDMAKSYIVLELDCEQGATDRWNALKTRFESLSAGAFEEYLFNKTCFLLNVPKKKLNLIIMNRTPQYDFPCFVRRISWNFKLNVVSADCKDGGGKLAINYTDLKPDLPISKIKMPNSEQDRPLSDMLTYLYRQSLKYFKQKGPAVTVNMLTSEVYTLEFQVANLTNEIVGKTPGRFSTIETLYITIHCATHGREIEFDVRVNGKFYGKMSNRQPHDMEPRYQAELNVYTKIFTNNVLSSWLKSMK